MRPKKGAKAVSGRDVCFGTTKSVTPLLSAEIVKQHDVVIDGIGPGEQDRLAVSGNIKTGSPHERQPLLKCGQVLQVLPGGDFPGRRLFRQNQELALIVRKLGVI